MDVQMPEMDGLAATRALRADPRFGELPIIAMTANAIKAELEACLAAGMNDHVIKPIDRRLLLHTLRRWLPAGAREVADEPEAVRHDTAPPAPWLEGVDVPEALQRLGLEFDSLRRLLVRFADTQGPTLDGLRAAVAAEDAALAARHAHTIGGSAGNLGASDLRTAAKALEQAARDGRTDLQGLLADVEERAAIAFRSIDALRGEVRATAPPEAARPFDVATARAALERLRVALGDFEIAAVTAALAEVSRLVMPEITATDLVRLRDRVDGIEYDEATVIATRLLEQLDDEKEIDR
jgi:two-component system sensor histidine kinase/response regulator